MSDETVRHGVAILYLSVGAGHRIAAEALASALRSREPQIDVTTWDVIEIAGSRLLRCVPRIYSQLMGRLPGLYDRLWRSERTAACSEWLQRHFRGRARRAVREFLAEAKPSAAVTTHGWACRLVASARREGIIKSHIAIPTDFGMHAYWPLEDVDEYVVSTRQMRDRLVLDGFPPERVHVLGIPLRPAFAEASPEPTVAGGEPEEEMPTVLLIAGALGTGYYRRASAEIHNLLTSTPPDGTPFRVVIVTGSEGPQKAALQETAAHFPWPVEVLGLVENMHEVMDGADLLVTKPGGLIVAEGLAKGLPMVLIGPSAGQERANAELLLEEGVAVEVTKRGTLYRQIHRALTPRHRLDAMTERARGLGHPEAAYDVANLVKAVISRQPSVTR